MAEFVLATVLLILLLQAPASIAQDSLGTPMGIPNSSPAISWPRSFSLETVGGFRLYPNGPEFGLSTTAGGFGAAGTSRVSGIGLAERSLPTLMQNEIERPYIFHRGPTDTFNTLNGVGGTGSFSGSVLGSRFRSGMQLGSGSGNFVYTPSFSAPEQMQSVDSVLQDRPSTVDSVLKTGL